MPEEEKPEGSLFYDEYHPFNSKDGKAYKTEKDCQKANDIWHETQLNPIQKNTEKIPEYQLPNREGDKKP